jgi:hypothetical protein
VNIIPYFFCQKSNQFFLFYFLFSLSTAIVTLIQHKVHRIPVIDPINHDFLFLITHKRILKFLYLYVCYLKNFYEFFLKIFL